MATKTKRTKRASLDELLVFANQIRAAGAGNPLDALMPAVPADTKQCLIARNLNFNCTVLETRDVSDNECKWVMFCAKRVRDKIVKTLDLSPFVRPNSGSPGSRLEYGVILPPEIGQVAADFDDWKEAISVSGLKLKGSKAAKKRLQAFWPYIEESVTEAYANADFINEAGEIVID